ncbi:hypothetical protein ZWY2020_057608 [Hordeum vulgare]|nr:hypothetical protein ZWY2020_057608 [Hordeum vulgare]
MTIPGVQCVNYAMSQDTTAMEAMGYIKCLVKTEIRYYNYITMKMLKEENESLKHELAIAKKNDTKIKKKTRVPTGSLKTSRKNRSVYEEKDAAKYEGDGGESDRCGDVGEGARGDGHTRGGGCGGEGAFANQEEAARGGTKMAANAEEIEAKPKDSDSPMKRLNQSILSQA